MEEQRVLGAAAGFDGAEQTLRKGGEWLRAEVATAGLRGRGGAAFPVWTKWEAALARPEFDREHPMTPTTIFSLAPCARSGGPSPRASPAVAAFPRNVRRSIVSIAIPPLIL